MRTAKNFRGYTLIELLVVITISVIIFGLGIAGYREFSRRQALTGVTKSLKADLRLAQQLALTGQKPVTGTCLKLVGYSFDRTGPISYELNAKCDNSGTMATIQTKSVVIVNATITMSPTSILFKVLGQGTNLSTSNTINLTQTTTGNSSSIIVGIGGDVQ